MGFQYVLGRKNDIAEALEIGLLSWVMNAYNIGAVGANMPATRALYTAGIWFAYNTILQQAGLPFDFNLFNGSS